MEESDADLLFISVILLLTVVLCTSLRLSALHNAKTGFKRKLVVSSSLETFPASRAIVQSPSTPTSLGATLCQEEGSTSVWTRGSHYLSPGFLGANGSMEPRATFLVTAATRTRSVSGIISKRQTVRYFSEKIVFSKLSIDLGAATEPKQISQLLPANLYFNFVNCHHQDRVLRGLTHAASGILSVPRFNYWSRNSEVHLINLVTSGDLAAYSPKKLYPYDHHTEVGVEDGDVKGAIDSQSAKHTA